MVRAGNNRRMRRRPAASSAASTSSAAANVEGFLHFLYSLPLFSVMIKLKTANIERNRVDLHTIVTAAKWKETSIVMSIFN